MSRVLNCNALHYRQTSEYLRKNPSCFMVLVCLKRNSLASYTALQIKLFWMEIPATLGAADVQMSSLAILLTITVNVTTMPRHR